MFIHKGKYVNTHEVTGEDGKMTSKARDSVNNSYFIVANIVCKYHRDFKVHPQNIKKYYSQSLSPFLPLDSRWLSYQLPLPPENRA